ncbi:MAG: hypothetical protein N3B18_13600 [Desulfobacterota bacterium]|nr:hypothetical protein [Thermodesulfobacteriota bacterium]
MDAKKARLLSALFVTLACSCCEPYDPHPPQIQPILTVRGIYECPATEAETGGGVLESDNRSGARVEAYALSDNGTQTLVAGGAQQITTNQEGGFEIQIFTAVKNLLVRIQKDGRELRCVLTGIVSPAATDTKQSNFWVSRIRANVTTDNATDNATEYAIVNGETDIEAALLIAEASRSNIPPQQVNPQDIDELIAPDVVPELLDNSTLRNCVIERLTFGRIEAKQLFIDILKDQTINQESVQDAEHVLLAVIDRIERLRSETRKRIYQLKLSGDNDTHAHIQQILDEQQRQVLAIFKEVGVPPQLYMKASLIAQASLERSIYRIGPCCSPERLALGNKLIRRVLIRRVQEDAQQTVHVAQDVFGFSATAQLEEASMLFREKLMRLDPNLDAAQAHGEALRDFYQVLVHTLLAAVDDTIVPDQAITQVLEAVSMAREKLKDDLKTTHDAAQIKAAYLDYFSSFRDAVESAIPCPPDEVQEKKTKKKVLIDLLFSISTH